MSAPEREPREWLLRAQNDLLNIDNNLRSTNIPWDTMVFHAQQVCEKLLKALIVQKGSVPPRAQRGFAFLSRIAPTGGPAAGPMAALA